MAFEDRYQAFCLGDLREVARTASACRDAGDIVDALAVETLWALGADAAPTIAIDSVESLGDSVMTSPAGAMAVSNLARRAFIELDVSGFDRCLAMLRRYPEASPGHRSYRLWRGFRDAVFGDDDGSAADGADLHRDAKAHGEASLAVDATTLQAAYAMGEGKFDEALRHARRAARMAQSEHTWMPHYFASLFLARLRRLMGNAHLAVRIIDACLTAMPRPWKGWLWWERVCAGASTTPIDDTASELARSAASLQRWVLPRTRSAVLGAMPTIDASVLHRQDLAAAVVGLDAGARPPAAGALHDWVLGRVSETPPHLRGFLSLAIDDGASTESAGAWVCVRPGEIPRRVIDVALPADVPRLGRSKEQATRVSTLIAALALAPEGLRAPMLFEQVYGFRFRPDSHEGSFRVLRHHAWSHVRPHAEVEREGDVYRLVPAQPFAVVDPRTVRPFKDIMLRHLARAGGSSARDVAEKMRVPLRTVQTALKEMVSEGACASERRGRAVAYEVEDTTFAPLTMV